MEDGAKVTANISTLDKEGEPKKKELDAEVIIKNLLTISEEMHSICLMTELLMQKCHQNE